MRIFVDTNVLLDVLARRMPFYSAAAQVWSLAERNEVRAFISAISFNNIYYVVRRLANKEKADGALRLLRDVFEPIAPDAKIVNQAIDAGMTDFEDAIQFHSALRAKADCLVTRNVGDFPDTGPPVFTCEEFLALGRTKWEKT
jgi:predicted nucleic acid-binding protein